MTPAERYEAWKRLDPKHFQEVVILTALAAERLIARGFRHYGMHALIETVRFHYAMRHGPDADGFKVGNTHEPYLARELTERGLVPPDFFAFRELTSQRGEA